MCCLDDRYRSAVAVGEDVELEVLEFGDPGEEPEKLGRERAAGREVL